MPTGDASDRVLIDRAAAGDSSAFGDLYDRHSSTVFGLLLRILRRRSEAEEVLQDVFLDVWRNAGSYRPDRASPKGWILMMARSRGLDLVRSRDARRRREEDTARGPGRERAANPAAPERLERAERRRSVTGALFELPDEQRRAIELAFYGGLTHPEIAARTEAPLGTVKSRILLGMKKLRRSLDSAG